ncbi:MAG: hypothetical protein A3K16_06770 [Omnitrophica bacterium RIFCSPLOWO2_01_FULL_45_24]|nr:MAG: hypothetical protein A3K16_06770 [Omnitrophica bacterium RIFCSPLOWO2_01_FULL_45_24]
MKDAQSLLLPQTRVSTSAISKNLLKQRCLYQRTPNSLRKVLPSILTNRLLVGLAALKGLVGIDITTRAATDIDSKPLDAACCQTIALLGVILSKRPFDRLRGARRRIKALTIWRDYDK